MTLLHYFFDLTSFKRLGRNTRKHSFVFLGDLKTPIGHFEINWPLDRDTGWYFANNFGILQTFHTYFFFSDNKRVTPSRYVGSSTSNLRNGNSKEDLSRSSSSASNRYLKLQLFYPYEVPAAVSSTH